MNNLHADARSKLFGSCLLILAFAWTVCAQPGALADKTAYPAAVEKNLYADVDLRGKSAPKFEVEKWVGGRAPDMTGKVVLIDFWATWCGPCRGLIPELNELQKKFKNDLVVIGVSDEPIEELEAFKKSNPMEYAVATDQLKRMKKQIGVKGIPHVLVITPDNIVRWQGFPSLGSDPLTAETVARIIAASKGN